MSSGRQPALPRDAWPSEEEWLGESADAGSEPGDAGVLQPVSSINSNRETWDLNLQASFEEAYNLVRERFLRDDAVGMKGAMKRLNSVVDVCVEHVVERKSRKIYRLSSTHNPTFEGARQDGFDALEECVEQERTGNEMEGREDGFKILAEYTVARTKREKGLGKGSKGNATSASSTPQRVAASGGTSSWGLSGKGNKGRQRLR